MDLGIGIVIGLVMGALAAYVALNSKSTQLHGALAIAEEKSKSLEAERARLTTELGVATTAKNSLDEIAGKLREELAALRAEITALKSGAEAVESERKLQREQHEILLRDKGLADQQSARVTQELADARERLTDLGRLQTEVEERRSAEATLLAEKRALNAKAQELELFLKDARTQLADTFKVLAGEALKESRTELQESAKVDLEARQQAIHLTLAPVRETLGKLKDETEALEKQRNQDLGRLKEQLDTLGTANVKLSEETKNLILALKSSKARGAWGEIALQRILELAGLTAYVDFTPQESQSTSEGRTLRPDCVVRLPGGRAVVIDAKVPFAGYYAAHEATTDEERALALTRHAAAVADHVKTLSAKAYQEQLPEAAEFVVMFVPNDTFLAAAVEQRPDLMDFSLTKRVLIVTPAALMALLHTIELGWRQDAALQNADEIRALGEELCQRLGVFIGHLEGIGKGLENAQLNYKKALSSFESRVLVSARKFPTLGVKTAKKLSLSLEGEIATEPLMLASADDDETPLAQRN